MNKGQFKKGIRIQGSREQFFQNETRIISWIYNWGFSIPSILRAVLGLKVKVATLGRLVKQNKVMRVETYLRSPVYAYHLAPQGVAIAEARLEKNVNYQEVSKEKVVTPHFTHDLTAQALTMIALQRGVAVDYATPRMSGLAAREVREDVKIPDVLWRVENDTIISVEVETEQKWERKLDNFLAKTVESIESGEIYECLVVSPSRATVRNYLKSLERASIPVWSKKAGGVWRLEREVEVRQAVRDRISILYVSEMMLAAAARKLIVSDDLEHWMNTRSFGDTSGLE